MRCPDCSKFVSLDFSEDPEVESVEVDAMGEVTASVRIVRTCGDCGQEMKDACLDMSENIDEAVAKEHQGEGHELSANESDVEPIEEGGGRYAKSYFGASVTVNVFCSCQEEAITAVTLSDKVAASAMEELV